MKEELLKEAMGLARKFRECCENFENKKATASLESLQDILLDLTKHGSEFTSFCRALVMANIFNEEDMREIMNVAFPAGFISAEIVNFIKGLEGLDKLGAE